MQYNLLPSLFSALLLFLWSCRQPAVVLKEIKHFPAYPSGSGLAFLNNKIYLIGDDAANMLMLDEHLNILDSINIVPGDGGKIAKDIKPDLEAMTVVKYRRQQFVLALGSGSVEPYRELCWLVNAGTQKKDTVINLHHFYKRVINSGIRELNIEGLATTASGIVMANRGNQHFAKNFLIFTDRNFFLNQAKATIKLVKIGVNTDSISFKGISGLDYAAGSDKLLITVSTEDTNNNYTDGAIGKSYLWIVNDISSRKKNFTHLNPDVIIDLNQADKRFAGHKIESVCVIKETKKVMELLLAADDDKGDTWLFRLEVHK